MHSIPLPPFNLTAIYTTTTSRTPSTSFSSPTGLRPNCLLAFPEEDEGLLALIPFVYVLAYHDTVLTVYERKAGDGYNDGEEGKREV